MTYSLNTKVSNESGTRSFIITQENDQYHVQYYVEDNFVGKRVFLQLDFAEGESESWLAS